jgi:hypothetical protein
LEPGRTYRYRLVAADTSGVDVGAERTFTTSVPPAEDEEEEGKPRRRGLRGHGKRGKTRVRCARKACSLTLTASARPRTWRSPRFPANFGWVFGVFKDGESLRHTRPAGGCLATFTGRGMIATLNGCKGRFTLTYIGSGRFKVRWRVFERCRCADVTNRPAARRAFRRFR